MLGVQLLVSHSLLLLLHAHVHTRFDPPRGLHGRLGGVRLVSREAGMEMDDLFISAYAPQERDDETRQLFHQTVLEMIHSVSQTHTCVVTWRF